VKRKIFFQHTDFYLVIIEIKNYELFINFPPVESYFLPFIEKVLILNIYILTIL